MNGLDPTVLEEAASSRLEPPQPNAKANPMASEEAIQGLLVDSVLALKKASKAYQDKLQEENDESPDAENNMGLQGSGGTMSHD